MKILLIKENKEIVSRNISPNRNKFKLDNKLYLISNPIYYYSKLGLNRILGKKLILVYRENQPKPIDFGNPSINNQLEYEITNDLIFSERIKDIFNPQSAREIMFLFLGIALFGIGILIGKA